MSSTTGIFVAAVAAIAAIAMTGCAATNQINEDLQYRQLFDHAVSLGQEGIGVLTPSAPTGQEADRQALADALGDILEQNTDARVVTLPAMLSAINHAALARPYSEMFDEYDQTGLLARDVLRRIGAAADVRYVAKLNLGNFEQATSGRAKLFGVRFLDTRTANIRVHLEIWDTQTGGIVWQGNEELTFAEEGVREKPVTFQQVARLASDRLVAQVNESVADTATDEPTAVGAAYEGPEPLPIGECTLAFESHALAAAAIDPAGVAAGC